MPWLIALIAAAGIYFATRKSHAAPAALPPAGGSSGGEPPGSPDPAGLILAGYRTFAPQVARDAAAFAATLAGRGVAPQAVGVPASWAQIQLDLAGHAATLETASEAQLAEVIRTAVAQRAPHARSLGVQHLWWGRDGRAVVELHDSDGAVGPQLQLQRRAWLTLIRPDGSYYTMIERPNGELIEVTQ